MELTPTQVTAATFRTVRKGFDPDEVTSFLERAARALEEAQQQATAMEARARAAVARLQEVTAAAEAAPAAAEPSGLPAPGPGEPVTLRVAADDAETITRTLLLAQRSADAAVAEARAEAERLLSEALSAKLMEDARTEARKLSEAERLAAENEVQALVARREFLVGDVDQLEQFLIDQRERLRAAARQIEALCERVPAGLGKVRPPVLSASDASPGDDTSELFRPPPEALASALDDVSPPNGVLRPQNAHDG
jgi:DivIVA domain-containing protein